MQDNVIIGVNILEILTTGMYRDSRVIFREYIQNSCDQIDAAVKNGLLTRDDGQVEIWIDDARRSVSVEDNATGICALQFKQTLYNIADSQKTLGEDKGFRGIGHWCGLGYCKTLVFTSKAKGERIESIMSCDAEKMRQMMIEHNTRVMRYSIDDVLSATVNFSTNQTSIDSHYFKVEMFGITETNDHLLNRQEMKNYLSFVAPVPYANTFIYREQVYKHAQKLNVKIDEYNIKIDGETITKKYTTHFETSKGRDDVSGIDFVDIYDENQNLIAWLWYGLSKFIARINEDCIMRDVRLRKDNIQIGDATTLKDVSRKGDKIGTNYTIGEVFAISKWLIPTSQRDYFEDNNERRILERRLHDFFTDTLHNLYNKGSEINAAFDKIERYEEMLADFQQKTTEGKFIDKAQRDSELGKLEVAKTKSEEATRKIIKLKDKLNNNPNAQKILEERERERVSKKTNVGKNNKKHNTTLVEEIKPIYVIDAQLPHYSKQERKLIEKIFSIIATEIDVKTAQILKTKIIEGLK
jgi:molecular chaperone HtpG